MTKTALITGVTGQDGAYLAQLLLDKGYAVHGIKRRASLFNTDRVDHLYEDPHVDNRRFQLHYGDLTDSTNLIRIVQQVQPDEIYNLGAMSHVAVSFEQPEYTADANGMGTCACWKPSASWACRRRPAFYQASTSELYGLVQEDRRRRPRPSTRAALCGGQALRLLDHRQLPRGLRPVRLQRHPLQPREPAARRDLRDAQDHARHGAHRAGPAGLCLPGQPGLAARLGPCTRLRADAVADAAAGRARRLCHRHRRAAQRARLRAAVRGGAGHHGAIPGPGCGRSWRGDRRCSAPPANSARAAGSAR
jgi:hypothetical protein